MNTKAIMGWVWMAVSLFFMYTTDHSFAAHTLTWAILYFIWDDIQEIKDDAQ